MSILYDGNGNEITVSNGGASVEPSARDIPCVYITGTLPTAKAEGELPVILRYVSATDDFTDHATLKVQGDSSAGYAKKNFTVKLYKDSARETKDKREFYGWKARNKFVMKANWIDHSHCRNVVSARIWSNIMRTRKDFISLPPELTGGHMAVDGFPVKVFANGIYQGLYTWNIPKDGMYSMDDDNDKNCIMQGNGGTYTNSHLWRDSTLSNWTDELHDSMPHVIRTSWTAVMNFVATSSDTDFVAKFSNYFDKQSVIDQYIFLIVGCIVDNIGKNQTFFTYDAVTWYGGMYDLDGTWGLPAFAITAWLPADTAFQTGYTAVAGGDGVTTNYLYERIGALFATEAKARYWELRASVLSADNIIAEFERFTQIIPNDLYAEDVAETTANGAFTGVPLASTNNIQQIRKFVVDRLAYTDTLFV